VLGGYLQFEAPGVFHRLSDNSFELNLNKTKYIERLYELHRYSNVLEKLGLPVTYGNTPSFDETLAVTDTYIRKFLKLNNTLIVSLPTAVTTEQLYFSQNNGPGYFSSLTAPSHCLFSSTGKLIEYFRMKHTNAWAGCVVDYIYENLILSSIAQSKIDIINASSKPGHLRGIAGAHLLKISAV
jgi:tRNA(His) 5'-end guanylyltransferase